MGYWKRHPKKEGEEALQKIAALGWRIENPPRYYTIKCPCGDHQKRVHLTPSNPRHYDEAVRYAKRTCRPGQEEEP